MFAASKTASSSGYQISRSLRFNSADSAYLNRTPAGAGNRRKWTFSAWVKRSSTGDQKIFTGGTGTGSTDYLQLYFGVNDKLRVSTYVSDLFSTDSLYRDYSAWYHIVWNIDTDNATATNRMQAYVNNTLVATANVTGDLGVNQTQEHDIGRFYGGSGYFNGYMTEINFIDGQALTPSSFGQTDAQTGVWGPKAYSGSYGTNGFYLNFSDNSNTTAATLGKDYSGNGNNWTPNNFSVTAGAGNDSLVDSPTSYGGDTGVGGEVRGNYATLNPLFVPTGGVNFFALSNGNLDITGTSATNSGDSIGTISTTTGKYYFEINITSIDATGYGIVGASDINQLASATVFNFLGYLSNSYGYRSNGNKFNSNTSTSYGSSYTTGDVIGVAIDCDNGAIYFSKNNTWQASGVPTSGASRTGAAFTWTGGSQNMVAQMAVYKSGTTLSDNFGQRPFAYTAPSGFKALNTQNLPTPTIGATTATQAGKYFNAVTYTGTGSSLGVTGVGFQPDWVWIKGRSGATDHGHYDAVRGVQKQLESNNTGAETTETTGITAFGSDGFTTGALAQLNTSSATYVAWNWKANGAGSSNTSGSITSTVSASTASGFSVVTYTGTGVAGTIGHGLGVAPSMIIVKSRSATGTWPVYFSTLGNGSNLVFNTTAAAVSSATIWNSTSPTSSVFSVGLNTDSNTVTVTYVAYCFAPIAGYSAFGSYTGNGSVDGPFVYTGFRPKYIFRKWSDGANQWVIFDTSRDTYNVATSSLYANLAVAEEYADNQMDILSNGFKLRYLQNSVNGLNGTYIYMAFAENPFKYANAK